MKTAAIRWLAGLLTAVWAAAPGWAQLGDERAALLEQRRAVERRYSADQAACAQKFAVTTCSEQARLKRRDELVLLQKAEALVDARDRRAASERRTAAALRPSDAASTPRPAAVRVVRPAKTAALPGLQKRPAPRAEPPERMREESRARAAHDQRQREADTHRTKVEARNAARAASSGQRSAPLPPPPAASAR